MSTSALVLAEIVIAKFHDEGESISQLKLQKILYYIKGWSLYIEKQARFPETLEAWDYGPLVYSVRQAYGRFGRGALALEHAIYPADDLLIDAVIQAYGSYPAERLMALTHQDAPWRDHYRCGQDHTPIPDEALMAFFTHEAVKNPVHARFLDTYAANKYGGRVHVDTPPPSPELIASLEVEFGL